MTEKSEEIQHIIPSKLEELNKIESISSEIAQKMDFSKDLQHNLSIAVTEAVGNAIVHGNKKDINKEVHILFKLKQDQVDVEQLKESFLNELDKEYINKNINKI